jgi:hypothetical protein
MMIIARNKVRDIDTFLKGGQERNDLFATAASSWQTFQDKDDPTSVVLEIEVTDMDKFVSILNAPANVEMSERHTVIRPVIISMPAASR